MVKVDAKMVVDLALTEDINHKLSNIIHDYRYFLTTIIERPTNVLSSNLGQENLNLGFHYLLMSKENLFRFCLIKGSFGMCVNFLTF